MKKIIKFNFAGETLPPTSKKALKISTQQIFVNVKFPNGFFERIPCLLGKTLFENLKNQHVPIGGWCNNETPQNFYSLRKKPVDNEAFYLQCSGCMCKVQSPWFEKIPMHDIEKEALYENPQQLPYGENRRYACTFNLEKWMDEMVIELQPIQKENGLDFDEGILDDMASVVQLIK